MRNISPLHFQRSEHDRMFVAAIDFGTHGSGFAVCTRANYKKDCNKIYIHQWKSGTTITCKAPTTVLMQPGDQHCISFGYEAEEEYLNMNLEDQKKHYFFRQFKMGLFKTAVSKL